MKKEEFKKIVEDGRNRDKYFMVVKIVSEDSPAPEIIINPAENFAAKLAYYDKAYNDDMELIGAKNAGKSIRITDVLMTRNLNGLKWFVF